MQPGIWRIEKVIRDEGKPSTLPYLITLHAYTGAEIQMRCSGPWPAPGHNLYAMRSDTLKDGERTEPFEECRIVDIQKKSGPKATTVHVVLDRKRQKRCSFLFVRKDGREQVFFRTESGIKAHRSRTYLQPSSLRVVSEVVIDSREKYPWNLNAEHVVRRALSAGDYALCVQEKVVAVIERKTLANMLANLNALEAYHTHLAELTAYPGAELVVEASLADFFNPEKVKPMSSARCVRALADIAAKHPSLRITYAGNRKNAQLWAAQYFGAVAAQLNGVHEPAIVQQSLLEQRRGRDFTGGLETEIRHTVMFVLPASFQVAQVRAAHPDAAKGLVTDCLNALRSEGKLRTTGHGRGTVWARVESAGTRRSTSSAAPNLSSSEDQG